MATTEFSHPTSPTFADVPFPAVPRYTASKTVEVYLKEVDKYLADQFTSISDMQSSITQGWIVDGLRVINLTADNITANTIFTNDFYIGSDGNGSIAMSGTTTQIIIKDENGTDRVITGKLGAAATDWGAKFLDSTGTVKFQTGSITFIDGAIITNATITGGKIANATITGGNIGSNTVANSNIASGLSTSKVTTGTLTCSSSEVAIDVTSGGAVILRNGADIIMRASASGETSFLSFRTSSDSSRGNISYSVTDNEFRVRSVFGAQLKLYKLSGVNEFGISIGNNITLTPETVTVSAGNFRADTDNTRNLGTASIRWADVRSVLINGADFCFENGFRLTEPNHIYSDGDPSEGIYFMNDLWQPIALLTRDGHLFLSGSVAKNWVFGNPDIPRRESKE